jgi:hypothetical protein
MKMAGAKRMPLFKNCIRTRSTRGSELASFEIYGIAITVPRDFSHPEEVAGKNPLFNENSVWIL